MPCVISLESMYVKYSYDKSVMSKLLIYLTVLCAGFTLQIKLSSSLCAKGDSESFTVPQFPSVLFTAAAPTTSIPYLLAPHETSFGSPPFALSASSGSQ